jgi:hypothetical protein
MLSRGQAGSLCDRPAVSPKTQNSGQVELPSGRFMTRGFCGLTTVFRGA